MRRPRRVAAGAGLHNESPSGLRRSRRHAAPPEENVDFVDYDVLAAEEASRPRRSVRAAAIGANTRLNSASMRLNSSDEGEPALEDLVPEPLADWQVSDRQSPHLLWFMPQIGDQVRVFYEGLKLYFVEFCSGIDLPEESEVADHLFTVVATSFAKHSSGALHCRVTLSADGQAPLTLPFHSTMFLTDYMVHETCIRRSSLLEPGKQVQAYFSDECRWYVGRLLSLSPGCWSGARVQWTEEEEADMLHPWELFEFDKELHPLGAVQVSLKVLSADEETQLCRMFQQTHPIMCAMLRLACFKGMRVARRGTLANVLYPMSFERFLNRLRNKWYRSVAAARADGLLLVESAMSVSGGGAAAALELIEQLKQSLVVVNVDDHDEELRALYSDVNAPLFAKRPRAIVPEEEDEEEEEKKKNLSSKDDAEYEEEDDEDEEEREEEKKRKKPRSVPSSQTERPKRSRSKPSFQDDDDEYDEDEEIPLKRRHSSRPKRGRKDEEEEHGEQEEEDEDEGLPEARASRYSLRRSRSQPEPPMVRRSSRFKQ